MFEKKNLCGKINDKSKKYRSCQYYYGKLQVDDSLVPTDVMYAEL